MFPVFTSVQVINPEHARAGQAGYVVGTDPGRPDELAVKFDQDGAQEAIARADVKVL